MAGIHITDIESAINWWRSKSPSPDGVALCPELRSLAEVYGLLVFSRQVLADEFSFPKAAYAAWREWYDTTPDSPCIAICSTSQGDAQCKGCGRMFEEVRHWTAMSPAEKRGTWRRINMEASSWRYSRYVERSPELSVSGAPGKIFARP